MGWLREKRLYKLNKENISRVPNTGGNYKLYNADRKPVYAGTTKGNWGGPFQKDKPDLGRYRYGLRHRLGSYIQKDDYREHPTKKALRNGDPKGPPGPDYFMYDAHRSDSQRRAQEKNWKKGLKHNHW